MENQTTPCKALVLAGGGARGSYQVGVWKALMELDWHPQIITGTSVGSLNGAMFVLDQYETARDMWLSIRSKDVMELPEEDADLSALHQFLRSVVKAGGMDVTPLEEIVERVLDEDALRAAPIRFGLVTVEQRGLRPRELTLEDIPAGQVRDYLMASAACFPALRARQIDGVKFLDGGYSDNMPTGLAKTMGAEELVCVDLEGVGITRPNLTGLPTTMIRSYWELGDILHFDPDTAKRNMELGYYDTLRAFGRIRGCAYAVDSGADSSADAEAFRAAFDAVQKEVREKYPVTLTADAALLLARMKDAQLAPLEAAAEDAGVDPTLLRKRIGMVFQKANPFPMSIYDNVAYGPRTHGVRSHAKLDDIVERSLRSAAIWDEVKDRLKKSALGLSGGQQQRLCIARALAVEPEVLLMDESTSALDPISTSKIEDLAAELKNQYTVVMVTHNMQQAARISDNTAFFLLGELVEFGKTEQLFSTPADKRTEDYITGRFG